MPRVTYLDRSPKLRGQEMNKLTMATTIGKSARELDRMVERGCPVRRGTGVKGKEVLFDSADVFDWCLAEATGRLAADGDLDIPLDGPAERARLWHEQANGQEMKNAQLRGELAHWRHVMDFVQGAFANARQQALAIPTKAAPDLIGQEDVSIIKDRLTEVVHDVLAELAVAELPEWLALAVAEEADREGDAGDAGGEVEGVPRDMDAAAEADGDRWADAYRKLFLAA